MKQRLWLGLASVRVASVALCVALTTAYPVLAQVTSPPTPAASQLDAAGVQTLFEQSAAELKFFDLGPFLYNRPELDFNFRAVDKKYSATLAKVTDPSLPLVPIEALLTHADAKVRTLALAALFNRDDPQLLPLIVKLAKDNAPTFPGHGELSATWMRTSGIGPPKKDQTVNYIATEMVSFYTSRAKLPPAPPSPQRGLTQKLTIPTFKSKFDDYWNVLKARPYSASWFEVKLARASRGTSPTQPQYVPDIRRVRAELDAIPRSDRNWILLYLNGEDGSDALASEEELVAATRELGPTQLMRWLKDQPVSQLPDLHIEDWKKKVVLENARLLLQPSQVGELLQWGELERNKDGDSPLWFVAVADLDEKNGRSIIKAAWPRFQRQYDGDNQIELAVALAKQDNRADWPFIADWFFAPPPTKFDGTGAMGRQSAFVSRLTWVPAISLNDSKVRTDTPAPAFRRQLLAKLVGDPRFKASDFWAVYEMLKAANASQPHPIADVQKFYEAAWIGGEKSPAAWAALSAMKAKLRATSPQWSR